MAAYSICTHTFDIGDEPKSKALKPLEEAAEIFGAWQNRCDEDVGSATASRWAND